LTEATIARLRRTTVERILKLLHLIISKDTLEFGFDFAFEVGNFLCLVIAQT
jgi:hypothetical protein